MKKENFSENTLYMKKKLYLCTRKKEKHHYIFL